MRTIAIFCILSLVFVLALGDCVLYGSGFRGSALRPLDSGATNAATLGVKFYTEVAGNLTILYYTKSLANTGIHKMYLYNSAGSLLLSKTFADTTPDGQQLEHIPHYPLAACQNYTLAYTTTTGHYTAVSEYYNNRPSANYFAKLIAGVSGPYGDPPVMPTQESTTNYGVSFAYRPNAAECKSDYQVLFN